jgi:hypothetical protein
VAEYLSGPRIPNARRFDLDEVAELAPETNPLSLSHMMPTVERFAEECSKLYSSVLYCLLIKKGNWVSTKKIT